MNDVPTPAWNAIDGEPVTWRFGIRRGLTAWAAMLLVLCCSGLARCADVLVAQVAPSSGSRGSLASDYRAGARLYFDSVNERGGVNGATIVLETKANGDDPAATHVRAAELIARKPIAFMGAVGTADVMSMLPLLEASETPLLGPLVDAAGVGETDNRTVFHIRPNEQQEIEAVVSRLHSLGLTRIAVCQEKRSASSEIARPTQLQKTPQPLQVLGCGDAIRLEQAVGAVVDARAQGVVFAGQTEAAAAFVKALRARNSFAMVVVSSAIDAKRLTAMLPRAASMWLAVAQVLPNLDLEGHSAADSVVREFAKLRAASTAPVPASGASLAGFVSAKILVEALRRSGEKPIAADVLRSLRGLQRYDVGGMSFDFSGIESAAAMYTRVGVIDTRGVVRN